MSTDDQDTPHTGYITTLYEARNTAMKALAKASGTDAISPERMLWPASERPTGKKKHINAHTAVLEVYWPHLKMKRSATEGLEALWNEPFDKLPRADELGFTADISLSSLKEWQRAYASETVRERHAVKGEETHEHSYRVVLPVQTLMTAYEQLNDMVDLAGWTPDVEDENHEVTADYSDILDGDSP